MAEYAQALARQALVTGSYSGDRRAVQRFAGVPVDPEPSVTSSPVVTDPVALQQVAVQQRAQGRDSTVFAGGATGAAATDRKAELGA